MLQNKLKEKYRDIADYFDKPAWANRLLFYATVFASIALTFLAIIGIFRFLFPDFSILNNTIHTQYNATQLSDMGFYDNERYLLSALVQSLAATIALVITLSLVAVQLAAQSYSARVIDVYKRNPDMWILLCIYIFTIFYGLGLTKIIGLGILGNYTEDAIFVAYFMGFFAFVCLVPYMLKTLDLLKPSTVIKLLATEITKQKISDALEETKEIVEKDPVQPIIDIINGALEKNDSETVSNGLNAIVETTNMILDSKEENITFKKEASDFSIKHILTVADNSFKFVNSNSTFSTMVSLTMIGEKEVENNINSELFFNNYYLIPTGLTSSNPNSISKIGNVVGDFTIKCLEYNLNKESERLIHTLKYCGIRAVHEKQESGSKTIIEALSNICIKSLTKSNYNLAKIAMESLEEICKEASERHETKATCTAIEELYKIGIYVTNLKLEPEIVLISHSLLNLWINVSNNRNYNVKPKITECFTNLILKVATEDIFIENIGKDTATFVDRFVGRIIENRDIDSDSKKNVLIVVKLLGIVGTKAMISSTDYATIIINGLKRAGVRCAVFKYRAKTKEEETLLNLIEKASLVELNKMNDEALKNKIAGIVEATTDAINEIKDKDEKEKTNDN